VRSLDEVERDRRAVETEAGFVDEVERDRRAVGTEAGFVDEVERDRRAVETEAGFVDEVERDRRAVEREAGFLGRRAVDDEGGASGTEINLINLAPRRGGHLTEGTLLKLLKLSSRSALPQLQKLQQRPHGSPWFPHGDWEIPWRAPAPRRG
jgi:hypothetical protein